MERRSRGTLILVAMMAATALAMLLPAAVGFTLRAHEVARAFVYSAALLASMAGLIHLANRGQRRRPGRFSHPFVYLSVIYLVIPAFMAIPLTDAVPGLSFGRAWFEMISAFTTTGGSVIAMPESLPITLWRATVAWGGGLFFLVAVMALLAPLKLGGFELYDGVNPARRLQDLPRTRAQRVRPEDEADTESLRRLSLQIRLIAPVYLGATLALWVGLSLAGHAPVSALIYAMSTLSTSGIRPEAPLTGIWAELMVALVLLLALSRNVWPATRRSGPGLRRDPEMRLAMLLVALVVLALSLRGLATPMADGLGHGLGARVAELWASLFMALSFLTTTGFVTETGAQAFSDGAGFLLLALVLCGGGIATTAGGIKLLRVFALYWQARRELDKLVFPESVGGDGPELRALRREGAHAAWLFLMIFVFSLAALAAGLLLTGLPFEDAVIFATAALSTTGPLVEVAGPVSLDWAELTDWALALAGLGMLMGRLELLLLLSVFWRAS